MNTIVYFVNCLLKHFNLCIVTRDIYKERKTAISKQFKKIKKNVNDHSFFIPTISGGEIKIRTNYSTAEYAFAPGTFVKSFSLKSIALCVGVGGYKGEKETIWFLNEGQSGVQGWSGNSGVYTTEEYKKRWYILKEHTIPVGMIGTLEKKI